MNFQRALSLRRWCCLLTIALLAGTPGLIACAEPVKGVSLAHAHRGGGGYGSEDCRKQLAAIKQLGGTWVSLTGFAYMGDVNQPQLGFGGRMSEDGGVPQTIRDAHALGLKVLVKPHVWSRQFGREGKWAGDIKMSSEADWDAWFDQYTQYILHHARMAQAGKADALCVGVELEGTTDTQEQRWRKLIAEVRKVFSGHLTYASAWWEWPKIQFWDALDCVGIDAYFPVAASELAGEEEMRAAWAKVYDQLGPFANKLNKPICFTELGYSASARAGIEPWAFGVVNPDVNYQARLYKVALEEAGKRDYVVGVFVWKWFSSNPSGGREAFIVQDRAEVLEVLKQAWASGPSRRDP